MAPSVGLSAWILGVNDCDEADSGQIPFMERRFTRIQLGECKENIPHLRRLGNPTEPPRLVDHRSSTSRLFDE